MKNMIIKPLCLLMALPALFAAGCSNNDKSSEPAAEPTTVAAETTAPTVATEPVTTMLDDIGSTMDSAQIDDGKVSFNTLEIKRNLTEIESNLDNYAETYGFRGALYAKVGNDFEHHMEKGAANQGAHLDNSIYCGYYTGSVTKLFTSTAVMKLVEDKGLDLDSTLEKYFPKYAHAKDIAIRRLLTMTSGIPNYVDRESGMCLVPALELKLGTEESPKKLHSAVLDWIFSQELREDAGEYYFSDSNYFLLGDIIAAESKMSYEEYINTVISKPSFLTKTGFKADDSTARPYLSDARSAVLLREGVGYSSLGLISNVSDLLKFIDTLMSYQILSPDSLAEMFKDYGNGFGYGAFINGSRVSCMGKIDAFSSKLSFTEDRSQIYVALSNYSECDPNFIHRMFRNYMVQYRN